MDCQKLKFTMTYVYNAVSVSSTVVLMPYPFNRDIILILLPVKAVVFVKSYAPLRQYLYGRKLLVNLNCTETRWFFLQRS